MSQTTRLDTVIHRLRLARRIKELLSTGGPLELIRAAWRVFVRLARATAMSPAAALAQVRA